MELLITGGTGIIGIKLINRLGGKNCQIKLLKKETEKFSGITGVEVTEGDLLDYSSLEKACLGVDMILHMAAITHSHHEQEYFDINVAGTKNLIKAAGNNSVKKIIFISSTTANVDGGGYAHSKLLAEEEIKKFSANWIILRLSEVYGAGKKEAIAKLINIIKNNFFIPIVGRGDYLLSPVHIGDVLSAIETTIADNNIANKTYIIAGPEILSYNQIIDKIEKELATKKIKIKIPIFLIQFMANVLPLFGINLIYKDQVPRLLCQKSYDIEAAREDLNFNPKNFDAGLKTIGY